MVNVNANVSEHVQKIIASLEAKVRRQQAALDATKSQLEAMRKLAG